MATPITAKASETTKTVLNPLGMNRRIRNARSGPVAAPMVSSMRCTPKDLARCSGCAADEIRASRGAVRMPLPMRSPVTIPVIAQNPPANRKPIRASMDSP